MTPVPSQNVESVPCPHCQGQAFRPLTVTDPNKSGFGARYSVVECLGCGLVYSNPRLTGPALSAAYATLQQEATPSSHPPEGVNPPGLARRWWRHLTQRQVVGDWVEAGPVLDVGCDVGELLVALKARGLEVSGIEVSSAAVERCRARGLNVIQGTVEEVSLPESAYRTITLSHALEHFSDPGAVLRKLWRSLVPGGRLVVAVPNHDGLIARLFGPHWHGWDPPFHLTHFDPASMRAVLAAAGFQVESVSTRGNPEDVTRSLAKLLGRPVDALWMRAAFLPTWILGALGKGGELCAVAQRPLPAN